MVAAGTDRNRSGAVRAGGVLPPGSRAGLLVLSCSSARRIVLTLSGSPRTSHRAASHHKGSVLQSGVLTAVERLLKQEQDRGNLVHRLELHDLAYLTVRIMEPFIYTDLITGEAPDAGKAELAISILLGAHPDAAASR